MTDTDNSRSLAQPPKPASRWKRPLVLAGVLAGGIAVGAGGLALAATTAQSQFGWHHGPRLALIQHFALAALDSIGATSTQEAKIHDIIATNFVALAPNPQEHEALRKQALDLLRAPTIDRAAVEKLRAERIAAIDAKSKQIVGAVLDIADQLTPEQRAKLADHIEAMAQRGPMMGGFWGEHEHRGPMDGAWRGPHDGPMDGHGDGDGFDQAPGKD